MIQSIINKKINISPGTKQQIFNIAIINGWNTHTFQIFHKDRDGVFHLYGIFFNKLSNPAEISHECILKSLKHHDQKLYSRLFIDSEEVPFEVPLGTTNLGVISKPVPGNHKLYVLQ